MRTSTRPAVNKGIHLARNLTNFDSNVQGKRAPSFSRSTLNNHTEVGPAIESVTLMRQYQIASSKSAFGVAAYGLQLRSKAYCFRFGALIMTAQRSLRLRFSKSGITSAEWAPEVDNRFSFSPSDNESALASPTISSCWKIVTGFASSANEDFVSRHEKTCSSIVAPFFIK